MLGFHTFRAGLYIRFVHVQFDIANEPSQILEPTAKHRKNYLGSMAQNEGVIASHTFGAGSRKEIPRRIQITGQIFKLLSSRIEKLGKTKTIKELGGGKKTTQNNCFPFKGTA